MIVHWLNARKEGLHNGPNTTYAFQTTTEILKLFSHSQISVSFKNAQQSENSVKKYTLDQITDEV